jgi:hypothetical protein
VRLPLAGLLGTSALLLLLILPPFLFSACEVRFGLDERRWCGSCVLPNAVETDCAEAQCVVVRCNAGYGDCNGVHSDGCESNLRASLFQCGMCNNTCPQGAGCLNGRCNSALELANEITLSGTVALAVDQSHVYWSVSTTFESTIRRVPKFGGAATVVADRTSLVTAIRTSETHLYWLEGSGSSPSGDSRVRRIEKRAPASTVVDLTFLRGNIDRRFILQEDSLYFIVTGANGPSLVRVPSQGGTPETLRQWDNTAVIYALQARGEALVFAHFDRGQGFSSILEYTPEDATFTALAEGVTPETFTIDAENLYYKDLVVESRLDPRRREIVVQSLTTGERRTLAALAHEYYELRLGHDALLAFDVTRGTLSSVAFDGATRLLFGEQATGQDFTADERFVYFIDQGSILRLAR